jgi:transposase
MDNRNLSLDELRVLRTKAVESVVIHGLTQTKAGQIFGFSRTSMCKYIKEYKSNGEESFSYHKRGLKVGMRRKMEVSQEEKLIRDIFYNYN